jgi:hypothetical protein
VVGWTGATNNHTTHLSDKPTSRSVCLKSAADGHTNVIVALEFVESALQQAMKRYADDEGKAAAVTLRLTESRSGAKY